MKPLTSTQQSIYDFIKEQIRTNMYPPSIREICKACKLSSTSSVHSQLENLEKMGYIQRNGTRTRSIRIMEEDFYKNAEDDIANEEIAYVPIVGNVSAGLPILAQENLEGKFPIPISYLKNNNAFMLKIKGDSMINAGIHDGDLVLVNEQSFADNNEIIIALLDDSATCKRFFRENGYIRLQPENEAYSPIIVENIRILGKVIGLFRAF